MKTVNKTNLVAIAAALSATALLGGCAGSLTNQVADSPYDPVAFTTPGPGTWTVPEGVTVLGVVAVGGNGGGSYQNTGGAGAIVTAYIPVDPGSTITFNVGAGGTTQNGGGSTAVNAGTQYQVVAGGGGGAGASYPAGDAGGAGGAGEPGGGDLGGAGGSGGIGGTGGGHPSGAWGIQPGGDGGNGNGGAGGGGWDGAGGAGVGTGQGGEGARQVFPNQPGGGGGGGGYGGGGGGAAEYMTMFGGGGGGSIGPSIPGYAAVKYEKAPRNGSGTGSNGSLTIKPYQH